LCRPSLGELLYYRASSIRSRGQSISQHCSLRKGDAVLRGVRKKCPPAAWPAWAVLPTTNLPRLRFASTEHPDPAIRGSACSFEQFFHDQALSLISVFDRVHVGTN